MAEQDSASIDERNNALRRQLPSGPGVGHVVPGEGPAPAAIAFVGEQPGDAELRLNKEIELLGVNLSSSERL